ncbi:hypothetical protein KY320_02450 [Candidatus Woesearchaeota archaeon]|nr:hypothetical protein [Candidatus Woesearchaeota archaeon]
MDEPIDPYKELLENLEQISPVKKCPKCLKLTLQYDNKNHRIFCTNCGFEKTMPRMRE